MAKKVLVVDDEKVFVGLVEKYLCRAGYEAIVVYDGVDALERIEKESPDILVIGYSLTRLSGPEVLRRLKDTPWRCDAEGKIITRPRVITYWPRASDQSASDAATFESWGLGSSLALTKPFNPKELLEGMAGIAALIDAQ
jgi:DNA-binding response OmpR family regulator